MIPNVLSWYSSSESGLKHRIFACTLFVSELRPRGYVYLCVYLHVEYSSDNGPCLLDDSERPVSRVPAGICLDVHPLGTMVLPELRRRAPGERVERLIRSVFGTRQMLSLTSSQTSNTVRPHSSTVSSALRLLASGSIPLVNRGMDLRLVLFFCLAMPHDPPHSGCIL